MKSISFYSDELEVEAQVRTAMIISLIVGITLICSACGSQTKQTQSPPVYDSPEAEDEANLALIAHATDAYRKDHSGRVPDTPSALVPHCLAALPADPVTGLAYAILTPARSGAAYEIDDYNALASFSGKPHRDLGRYYDQASGIGYVRPSPTSTPDSCLPRVKQIAVNLTGQKPINVRLSPSYGMDWFNYDMSAPAGPMTLTLLYGNCRLYSVLYRWLRHDRAFVIHFPSGSISEVDLAMIASRPTATVVDRRGKRLQQVLRAQPDNLLGYFDPDGSAMLGLEGYPCEGILAVYDTPPGPRLECEPVP